MTDDQLRALVRDAVVRHLGAGARGEVQSSKFEVQSSKGELHPSQRQYLALVNVGDACVIEPAVSCNHCGYCKTHGH